MHWTIIMRSNKKLTVNWHLGRTTGVTNTEWGTCKMEMCARDKNTLLPKCHEYEHDSCNLFIY
jgi:hypothetical protein